MPTVCTFFAKFASVIVAVLSCFDRVIFKGHLQINPIFRTLSYDGRSS